MSIICRKGGNVHQHETVAAVRKCYGAPASTVDAARITDKQRKFLNALRSERGLETLPDDSDISKHEASQEISALLSTKRENYPGYSGDMAPGPGGEPGNYAEDAGIAASVRPVAPSQVLNKGLSRYGVPQGHYATESATGNNDLDFWRVQKPDKGKWAGYTFVNRVIGGRPSVAVRGATAEAALKAIAKDVPGASIRYGQELGRCSRCNRHLTDETSRALGIGPECRSRSC